MSYGVWPILRTDQRPLIWKNSNDHFSARGHPIYSMFGARMGFPVGPKFNRYVGEKIGRGVSRFVCCHNL